MGEGAEQGVWASGGHQEEAEKETVFEDIEYMKRNCFMAVKNYSSAKYHEDSKKVVEEVRETVRCVLPLVHILSKTCSDDRVRTW